MVCYSPTLLPDMPRMPLFLHHIQPPRSKPLLKRDSYSFEQQTARWTDTCDWQKMFDDLSEEETEFEETVNDVQKHGFTYLVPIGRTLTQQEEKNDAAGDGSVNGNSSNSGEEEEENGAGEDDAVDMDGDMDGDDEVGDAEPTMDLDADMDDLDEGGI